MEWRSKHCESAALLVSSKDFATRFMQKMHFTLHAKGHWTPGMVAQLSKALIKLRNDTYKVKSINSVLLLTQFLVYE